jgi:two-component system chemotaxis sensor kinase CheA
VTIVLPLTLSILPVLMLRLDAQPLAIPLAAVREVIPLDGTHIHYVSGRPALLVRGEALPIVDLAERMGFSSRGTCSAGIVAQVGSHTVVLRVDAVIGQDEVMIKPVEGVKPRGVAGATLSGDGVLVLVLDLNELLSCPQELMEPR